MTRSRLSIYRLVLLAMLCLTFGLKTINSFGQADATPKTRKPATDRLDRACRPRTRAGFKYVALTFAEHVGLGAGIEAGMAQIAGGSQARRLAAGLSSAGLVAGFKEGSDATSGADTRKMAAFHAFSIMIGAGVMAGARH